MFERFTNEARDVVVAAQVEARALAHRYIGTEHILLGLLTGEGTAFRLLVDAGFSHESVRRKVVDIVGEGARGWSGARDELDAEALHAIGIDLDEVRRRVEEAFGPGALDRARSARELRTRSRWLRRRKCETGRHVSFTPRAKKVLELSLREALRLKDNFIGSEHILLGILREDGGVAAMVLSQGGLSHERMVRALREGRGRSAS